MMRSGRLQVFAGHSYMIGRWRPVPRPGRARSLVIFARGDHESDCEDKKSEDTLYGNVRWTWIDRYAIDALTWLTIRTVRTVQIVTQTVDGYVT